MGLSFDINWPGAVRRNVEKAISGHVPKGTCVVCTSQPVLRAVRQSHKDADVPHKIWKIIISINMLLSMWCP